MTVDVEYVNKTRKYATILALRYGLPEYADDFGSYAVIKVVTGKYANLSRLFIDFKRHIFGATRWKEGRVRSHAGRNYKELTDSNLKGVSQELDHDTVYAEWLRYADEFELKGEDRIMFLLENVYGCSQREIGHILKRSSPMMCVLQKALDLKIKERMESSK